ncbi:sphingomyelin phosphodiesterase [Irpex rosettiformis]|uniref:Sphingomyelin phosphodiesterase n=1 Tax=Irpex rosettiformis TaxID=378272 RepID=A0ACB8UJC5_9APHY|nr:sphingomyelin phosphodiesterase [Irpex rosettiformis]
MLHSRLLITLTALLARHATAAAASEDTVQLGPSVYTAPGVFPTSVFKHYYNDPTATTAQPQPVITDPISHKVYPLSLTDPDHLPRNNTNDPHPLPPRASSSLLLQHAITQVLSIVSNPVFGNNTCTKCQASLEVAKFLAMAAPEEGPTLAVTLCNHFGFNKDCATMFGPLGLGGVVTQVVANADVGGYDGQMLCQNFFGGLCPIPPVSPLNLTGWFAKPKPNPLPAPKQPSGKRLKVLHISDLHLDTRYANGAEANCTGGMCCRTNTNPNHTVVLPAPRFGTFLCDTPYSLALAALPSIPILTNTAKTGFDLTLYTGDLVAHDPDNQLSRDYVRYHETAIFDLLKRILGTGPVYSAVGNHDSYNVAQDAPHSLNPPLASQFSWNYDHLAALWSYEGWLPTSSVQDARTHYAGYAVSRRDGLRIISLNTNLWIRANYFNYINMTSHDPSGMLRFLTDELEDAEEKGERVWIIGHVLSGWDGSNGLGNPTDLCMWFYVLTSSVDVDRFSPHVIANIFWGHTHEDQLSIFYANNATNMSAETAQAVSWVGPSLTPITRLNSGFRLYEVDSATFEVLDAHTWFSDVSTFPSLDHSDSNVGPTYEYEYSTRAAYGVNVTEWGPNDPLNATWWHLVTEQMSVNPSLVSTFNTFQGKSSVMSPNCTNAHCGLAKVCYIRSGSVPLARENCIPGFGSVQSPFSGK